MIKTLTLAAIFMVSAGAQAGWFSSDEKITGNYPFELNSYISSAWRDYKGKPTSQGIWAAKIEHPISDTLYVMGSPRSNRIMTTFRIKQFNKKASCMGKFIVAQVHIERKYPNLFKKAITEHNKAYAFLRLNDGTNSLILACGKDKKLRLQFLINNYKDIVEQEKRELAQQDY